VVIGLSSGDQAEDPGDLVTDISATRRTVIEPSRGWAIAEWAELIEYRDLLFFLVLRDVKVIYKQTILGLGWAVLRPLLSMVVFTAVFGMLARVANDGIPYPVFYFSALVPWTYFSSALTASNDSLVLHRDMLTKIYFPRLLLPLTPIIARLLDLAIALVVLAILLAVYRIELTIHVLALPILIALMAITVIGLGAWFSALAVHFRDVRFVTPFLIQTMMYAAPVVWPVSLIPDRFRLIYGLYPMAGVIEGFRAAVTGAQAMPWDLVGMGYVSASILCISGLVYFRSTESSFADVA
jgi:lipopolysaccharide transport system permease protein